MGKSVIIEILIIEHIILNVPMKLLIIGSGGREHALGWKLKQSQKVKKLYFAPGSAGTALIGENLNIDALDIENLLNFALQSKMDLTVVGPEAPLVSGIVNIFTEQGLRIFGPTKLAAQLESSKAWAAAFMNKYKIPQPKSSVFSDIDKAKKYIRQQGWQNIVIKADGLAAGKGVIIPSSQEEAAEGLESILVKKIFAEAGEKVVIQERLLGKEVSVLAFSDGKNVVPLLPAQDHKRIFDGNRGPNTGGMGAYSSVPFVDQKLLKKIETEILQPTISGMRKDGNSYKGVLYAGLMLAESGPKVLEYNVRFGDPETQPLMMLLNSDLVTIMDNCIDGNLKKEFVQFKKGVSVCVVLAAAGYPGDYKKGEEIQGLTTIKDPDIQVFHAGTAIKDNKVITNGGRVLGVTAVAENLPTALAKAYKNIGPNAIHFDGMHYRKDIGRT